MVGTFTFVRHREGLVSFLDPNAGCSVHPPKAHWRRCASGVTCATTCFRVGRELERRRRFHCAWPAFQRPALRPTRGSGLGALTDMSPAGDAPELADMPGCEHAVAEAAQTASARNRTADAWRVDRIPIVSLTTLLIIGTPTRGCDALRGSAPRACRCLMLLR